MAGALRGSCDFKVDPVVVFQTGDSLVDGISPGLAISCQSRPMVVVNVTGTEGLLQVVLMMLFGGPCQGSSCPYGVTLGRP